ncbi:hypothetical protein C8Q78DRAFT_1080532 [Trametes maxima]|nr:hypothetical protein C8Q78DRAFT_1080532 [Trametes maxima]
MATAAVLAPHDVPTTLNYYAPAEPVNEAPYSFVQDPGTGKPRSNIGTDPHPAIIHDVRGREGEYTLDKSGFQFVKWPSVESAFDDDERIKAQYYPEVEEILKKVAGGKRVFIFDHTIRRRKPDDPEPETPANRGPGLRVHVDQTYQAGVARVQYHLPDEAERLLKGRVRIINVWRPIENPVAHHPLAVSDWRTLDQKDLVPVRLIYPHREGSTFSIKYNDQLKWFYLSNQAPEEALLIKCYDSAEDRARLTPHTAFEDKTAPKDAPHRQSIEVRALVFDTE